MLQWRASDILDAPAKACLRERVRRVKDATPCAGSGRFSREEEAVQEALALWEERDRRRVELLAMLDEADAELARGEGIPINEESVNALAADIKDRLRRRIAAERSATPSSRR